MFCPFVVSFSFAVAVAVVVVVLALVSLNLGGAIDAEDEATDDKRGEEKRGRQVLVCMFLV